MNFADRLFHAVRKKESAVVVGIDPDPASIPRRYFPDPLPAASLREAVAKGCMKFAEDVIVAVADAAVAVKPQLAHFERLGPSGIEAYEYVVQLAQANGLIVIADGKRNDIGSTAGMYAYAYLGVPGESGNVQRGTRGDARLDLDRVDTEGPKADALTVNPYLGWDGISPFIQRKDGGKGVFVLVKTSNPSSGELQDLNVAGDHGGEAPKTLYERLAERLEAWNLTEAGTHGYGPVGAVVGATYPEQLKRLRALMPHVPFLIPGYGAQGGTSADVAWGFDENGLGAVVNASRSILYAFQEGESVASAARRAAIGMRDDLRRVAKIGV